MACHTVCWVLVLSSCSDNQVVIIVCVSSQVVNYEYPLVIQALAITGLSPAGQTHFTCVWLVRLHWTSKLDWWTDTKSHFYTPNETRLSVGLYDTS